jgi:hypothetical protein
MGRFLDYATQVTLAWMYGPAQFGSHALGITVVQMANILAQLGILMALCVPFAVSVVLTGLKSFGAGFLAGEIFGDPPLHHYRTRLVLSNKLPISGSKAA